MHNQVNSESIGEEHKGIYSIIRQALYTYDIVLSQQFLMTFIVIFIALSWPTASRRHVILSIVGGVCGRGLHFSAFHCLGLAKRSGKQCCHGVLWEGLL